MDFELRQVGINTYYFNDTNRVVLFMKENSHVVLFDAGKNHKAGEKILKVLNDKNWILDTIFLTHSHADHMGGAAFLKKQTNCRVFAPKMEQSLTVQTIYEPAFMYGGFPPEEMCLPFLCAESCESEILKESDLPLGISMISLPGHTFEMVGFKTSDGIWFLADGYVGSEILSKHPISYLYDVEKYLENLDLMDNLDGELFIAAHAIPSKDIHPVIDKNRVNVNSVLECIVEILQIQECNFDQLLSKIFTTFNLVMNFIQHYLVGCTIKSYLIYLRKQGKIATKVIDNQLLWYSV